MRFGCILARSESGPALVPIRPSRFLPGSVMVARMALNHLVKVRILAGQLLFGAIATPLLPAER